MTCRVLLLIAPALIPAAIAGDEPIPQDFRVEADYMPGYGTWTDWRVAIAAVGPASGGDRVKVVTPAEADLRALAKLVRENEFFRLRQNLGKFGVTCGDFSTLKVTMDGRTHKVSVYMLDPRSDDPEVRRFYRVWAEVLERAPSPNKGQRPIKIGND